QIFHIDRDSSCRLCAIDEDGYSVFTSHLANGADIEGCSCCPEHMGHIDESCTWCDQLAHGFKHRTVSLWADVGNANHNTIAIADLVERCKSVGMFVVCCDYLVTRLPVEAVADNVHSFARVIR